ncbi:BspA family leucine-rich repeat surface protein [Agathobaculum sp. LCP25S3_E8]|uniref:BspA family leucine-rich repeat surface protein n=1 Tax=Agathobaculum sp. LCP25S3_E8 TaxID=3438735 RepID=UPI003F914A8F
MFEFCLALTSITFGKNFDTSNVDNLSSMFYYCWSLQQLDVSGFDTQSATNMYSMFYYCSALRQLDVSRFNTEKVTNMSNMFCNMQYIDKLDVSSFDTSMVTNMTGMFSACRATEIKGVENLDTSAVTMMSEMFSGCDLNTLDLRSWNTSNVENFQGMFKGCYALTTLQLPDPFVTSKAKTLDNLFASDKVLTIPDVSNWDTSNVVGMSELFSGCEKLTSVDLTKWKTDNVTSMYGMFKGCKALTELDLSSFNTANVTSMSEMFASCEKLKTLKVSDTFTTGKVTNMGSMFYSCKVLETIPDVVSHFDTSNVTSMEKMFSYCNALTNLSLQFNTSKVVDMGSMFLRSENLQTLDLGDQFNTAKVQTMRNMFDDLTSLTSLDLGEQFTIESVNTDLQVWSLFGGLQLESIEGVRLGETNKITEIQGMFYGCPKLKKVSFVVPQDGARFDELSSIYRMFYDCPLLEEVDLGNWILPNLTNTHMMFIDCPAVKKINLSWSGIRSKADLFTITDMFGNITGSATLEIGSDPTSQDVMNKIAQAFPGSVTVNGLPWSASNAIALPELPANELTSAPEEVPPQENESSESTEPSDTPTEPSEDITGEPEVTQPPESNTDEPEQNPEETAPSGEAQQTPQPDGEQQTIPQEPATSEEPSVVQPETNPEQPDLSETTGASTENNVALTECATIPTAQNWKASAPVMRTSGEGAAERATDSASIKIHPNSTPAGSAIQYRLRIKYVGGMGAQSGQVQLNFPIPEKVHVLTDSELSGMTQKPTDPDTGKEITADDLLVLSDVEYSDDAAVGYLGGRVVEEPKIVDENGQKYLRGTFEGLFTGNEYEIAFWCVLDSKAVADDGYTYWDGTAYAQDKAATAASNVYRLWYKSGDDTPDPPTATEHAVTYKFEGAVPSGVTPPSVELHAKDETVTLPSYSKPSTVPDYYTFDGWSSKDVSIGNSSFTMPDADVTIIGTWSINEASAPKITVTYEYTNNNEAQHIPDGAPTITPTQQVMVGNTHAIVQILEHADHHIFEGWKPTLTIGGTSVTLNDDNADGIYTGAYNGTTYTINTTGVLQTEQFRDANGAVTVSYTGPWHPYTGNIQLDANGGEGTMAELRNVTWDTKTVTIPQNTFTYPVNGYEFVGWATSPSGNASLQPGDSAAGLITQDGATVTLYAVWKRSSFEVGYALSNVTSSNTGTTVARGDSYTTILTPSDGCTMDKVSITVGGREVAIDPSIYDASTGQVNLSNVDGDIIIRASAVPITKPPVTQHTITVSVTGGTASHSGAVYVNDGDDLTITFTPNADYVLNSVTVDGSAASLTGNAYTFAHVTGNHTISVVYQKNGSGGSGGGGGGSSVTDKYPVHVEDTGNGTATSDKQEAAPGEVVTVDTNGTVTDITIVDKDGNEVPITDNGDGSFTFEMPNSEVTVKVEFEPLPEVADPNDTGVADWLDTVNHNSYLNGYPDGTFQPGGNMTRAEVAQMFYNLLLNKDVAVTVSFSDVNSERWYATAVNTLASLGIITGVGNEKFAPERAITRAEFTAIAMRFAKLDKTGINIFSDVQQSDWFYDYVIGSIQYGWITGYSDGTFRPNNTITRAEVTTITNRMLGRAADETYVGNNSSSLRSFADVTGTHWAYYQIMEATNSHEFEKANGAETWKNLK